MRPGRASRVALLVSLLPASLGPSTLAPEGASYPLMRALLNLEAGGHGKVRILHFGDSHVAGDVEPAAIRGYLQALWGDGGPGVGLPWTPPRSYRRAGLSSGMSRGWRFVQPTPSGPVEDTGLWGFHIEASSPGQSAWVMGQGAVVRIALLRQPGGGRFEVRVNGERVPLPLSTLEAPAPQAAILGYQKGDDERELRVEIRTLDSGKVRILGTTLERARPGVVYSNLGVVGQRAEALLRWREETFARLLSAETPDLVILAYGTNETAETGFDVETGARVYTELIERIRRAVPRALVLVVSAPDRGENQQGEWRTLATVPTVVAAQREAARRTGVAFLDLFAAMGGTGSVGRWVGAQPPLARSDGTHFTAPGYALLARTIVSELIETYNRVKASPAFSQELEGEGALLAIARRATLLPRQSFLPTPEPAPAAEARAERPVRRATDDVYYVQTDDGALVITNTPTGGRLLSLDEFRAAMRRKARAGR